MTLSETPPPKPWMPLWLATYIFVFGLLATSWFVDMYAFLMSENDVPCLWFHGYFMVAMVSVPWVWYFTHLGYRYLGKLPRLYYLWLAVPFYPFVSRNLDSKTLFSQTVPIDDLTIWFISISVWDVVWLCILLFVVHELWAHRSTIQGALS